MTTEQIYQQQQELQAQLTQLETDRLAAIENERQAKIDGVQNCLDEAESFRTQAGKADNDADRKRLYRWADDAEEQANELRKELGLATSEQIDNEAIERQQQKHTTARRAIFELLLFAFFAMVVFVISDFLAGQLDSGFVSYALDTVSKISYAVAGVYGGVWLVCVIAYRYISNYAVTGLFSDLRTVGPTVRLSLLAVAVAALVFLISNLIHHV